MNRGELREEVQQRLDEAAVPVYWPAEDIDRSLNNGLQEMADETEYLYKAIHIPILARRPYYDLRMLGSEDILSPIALFSMQGARWLRPTTVRELDYRVYVRWEENNGLEDHAILRGLWWLRLHPLANSDLGNVRLYCSVMPPKMDDDGQVPGFPRELHLGLAEYALYEAFVDDHQTTVGLSHYEKFLEFRARLKQQVESRLRYDKMWVFKET